jgi:hypothetical protein
MKKDSEVIRKFAELLKEFYADGKNMSEFKKWQKKRPAVIEAPQVHKQNCSLTF